MLKINKKVEYALISLKYISDQEKIKQISAREICDEFHIPFDTTSKVLQLMNSSHILKSSKGIKGGYSLMRSLSNISYGELVRIVEGKEELGKACFTVKGKCELYEKCNIVTPLEQLNKKLNAYLENLSLSELLLEVTSGTSFDKGK